MVRLVVMVTGSAPGVGKSCLAAGLARQWRDRGLRVEFFDEDDIRGRDESAELIGIWHRGNRPSLDAVLAAAAGYLESCRAAGVDAFVQDALFPFLASLLVQGYSDEDISALLTRLDQLAAGFDLAQVHIAGRPQDSIPRAAARERPGCLGTMLERARSWAGGDRVSDLASLAEYFSAAEVRMRRLLPRGPWPTLMLNADGPESDLLQEALGFLDPLIEAVGPHRAPRERMP